MPRLPYREGDWFAVPLANGGYAAGLVARSSPQGKILLGYFFGPRRAELPGLSDLLRLKPEDAVLVDLFGDLHLYRRRWPVLGSTPDWDRSRWPMPAFGAVEDFTGIGWRIEHPNEDPTAEPRETRVSGAEASRLPEYHLMGAGAVEDHLDEQLP